MQAKVLITVMDIDYINGADFKYASFVASSLNNQYLVDAQNHIVYSQRTNLLWGNRSSSNKIHVAECVRDQSHVDHRPLEI